MLNQKDILQTQDMIETFRQRGYKVVATHTNTKAAHRFGDARLKQ